jgi:rubrerythrin
MQSTSMGSNLTGAAQAPTSAQAMAQAADELSQFPDIDTSEMEAQRIAFIGEAQAVGSVPMPASIKGVAKAGMAMLKGGQPTMLLDKLGERLAFERTGTRLYDALIVKYRAAELADGHALPPAAASSHPGGTRVASDPRDTLERIRNEEFEHFTLLSQAILDMGGDPTSQTPSADVSAVASSGFMQVLTDPRTTLAQCLNAMLAVELADNAGWELLATLADEAGQPDLVAKCLVAVGQEQEHLNIIKAWLTATIADKSAVAA